MSEPEQLFSASLAKDAVYKTGLRSFSLLVPGYVNCGPTLGMASPPTP